MRKTFSSTVLRFGLIGAIALPLAACGGESTYNRSVESVHQPVVSYSTFTYDVRSDDGLSLSPTERTRMAGWLDSLNIAYGDSVAIADSGQSVSQALQRDIANVLGQRGLLIGHDASGAAGTPMNGSVRLIVRRSSASVPGCPDWSRNQETSMSGGTSSNFGCGVNGNLAAMIANPEDLVRGQTTDSDLRTTTSNRAIQAYREQAPTGAGGLK